MTVSDGQPVNASVTNAAFVSRTADDNTIGKKDLQNVDAASGADVINAQREVNSLNSFTGRASGSAHDVKPPWTNNDIGTSTDDVKTRADSLTAEFNDTTGHTHTGAPGDAPPVSAADLTALNYFKAIYQSVTFTGATGTSDDVSTPFAAKTAGGGASTLGVLTVAPDNRVSIFISSTGDQIEDGTKRIFGRLTEAAGVWTLTYLKSDGAGGETSATVSGSVDIIIAYREVFNLFTIPTIADDTNAIHSLDTSLDISDASASLSGKVNITAQTFAGDKTFQNDVIVQDNLLRSVAVGITAFATGGQGSATQLTKDNNVVATVATAGDSVKLPVAAAGLKIRVFNDGANPVDVFPSTGDEIDALGVNIADSILADGSKTYESVASGLWRSVSSDGTGNGVGGINYIAESGGQNHDFESTANGYAAYADAAASAPVDGTGGSPTVTITRTTSTPLRKDGSGLITKDAANRQGEGVSYDFTIDEFAKSTNLVISFYYEGSANFAVNDGTLADPSDVMVYVYDVTNAVLIDAMPLQGLDGSGHFVGSFQTASDSTSYRLIWHVATTNATAWTFKYDEISVAPLQNIVLDGPVTDWQDFTPTGNWSTNTTAVGEFRRIGDSVEVTVGFDWTGAPDAWGTVDLPSGLVIDTAKITQTATFSNQIGAGTVFDAIGAAQSLHVQYNNSTSVQITYEAATSNQVTPASSTAPYVLAVNDRGNIRFKVPILGWGTGKTSAIAADSSRVVAASYSGTNDTSIATATTEDIPYKTLISDTHAAFNTSTGVYTVPVSGEYSIFAQLSAVDSGLGASRALGVLVNGTLVARSGDDVSIAGVSDRHQVAYQGPLIAGDLVKINYLNNSGFTATIADSIFTHFYIHRLQTSQLAAVNDVVAARYTSNAGQVLSTGVTAIFDAEDKVYDTHGAVTTGASWKFTAPVTGFYHVNAKSKTASFPAAAIGQLFGLTLNKNSILESELDLDVARAAVTVASAVAGAADVFLQAGDFIDISLFQNGGSSVTLEANGARNYISIHRIGGTG